MLDHPDLLPRLEQLRRSYPETDPALVAEVVQAVLSSMRGDLTMRETSLLHEVAELGDMINNARQEIAALQVDDITGTHIPSATDELDAIVAHTAVATEAILAECETLDDVAGKSEAPLAERLQEATTRIYEACGFQDITGQRITKVVATLKKIDQKISYLVGAFGDAPGREKTAPAESYESSLLNGPQLPQNAMGQSDIDRLLASFD